MQILKEKLGKSAEHWKTVRKNADLSPGLSLLLSLDLFLLIVSGKQQKYKHIDKKRINNKHTKIKNNVYVFFVFLRFPFSSQVFPSKSACCSKVSFVCFLFVYFFLSLLLSLCFPVVCMLFIFCLSDLF